MTKTTFPLRSLAVLSIIVALASWRFLLLGFEKAFIGAPFDVFLIDDRLLFITHIVAAPIALVFDSESGSKLLSHFSCDAAG